MKIFISLFMFFFAAACGNAQEPMRLDVHAEKLTIFNQSETVAQFDIEIARTEAQRSAGLMHRVDLPESSGMLFVFDGEAQRFFWMQNTPTPLDIIYADAKGVVVHIARDTTPFSTTPIPSRAPAQYAFEIHAGFSQKLGINVGQTLKHPVIGVAQ